LNKLDCDLAVDFDEYSFRKAIINLRDNHKSCERLGKNTLELAKERYNG